MAKRQIESVDVSLGLVSVPPGTFEHDAALSAGYQEFSKEVLGVSVLGLAAIGFLIEKMGLLFWPVEARVLVGSSVALLGGAVAFALRHRFHGPDSLQSHLLVMRYLAAGRSQDAERERGVRDGLFKKATADLRRAAACLALGCGVLALAFVIRLGAGTGADEAGTCSNSRKVELSR